MCYIISSILNIKLVYESPATSVPDVRWAMYHDSSRCWQDQCIPSVKQMFLCHQIATVKWRDWQTRSQSKHQLWCNKLPSDNSTINNRGLRLGAPVTWWPHLLTRYCDRYLMVSPAGQVLWLLPDGLTCWPGTVTVTWWPHLLARYCDCYLMTSPAGQVLWLLPDGLTCWPGTVVYRAALRLCSCVKSPEYLTFNSHPD